MHTRGGIPLLTLSAEAECKGMLCMDFASKGAHAPMLCVGGSSPTLSLIDLVAQRVVVTAGPAHPPACCAAPPAPGPCARVVWRGGVASG